MHHAPDDVQLDGERALSQVHSVQRQVGAAAWVAGACGGREVLKRRGMVDWWVGGLVGWCFGSASFPRHLRAFLAGLGECDGDRLLAAFHFAAFTALARPEGAFLQALHRALDALARRLSILSTAALFGSHVSSPLSVCLCAGGNFKTRASRLVSIRIATPLPARPDRHAAPQPNSPRRRPAPTDAECGRTAAERWPLAPGTIALC